MKTLLLPATLFSVCLAGAAEPSPTKPAAAVSVASAVPLFEDPVVARGKGLEIKRSQLDDAFISYKANLAARGQSLAEDQRLDREGQLLDRLIVTQILGNRATTGDKIAAKGMAEKFTVESIKAASSEEMFNRQIKALGMSPDQFNKKVNDQALAEAVLERELKSTIAISDAQVEDFYKTGSDLLVTAAQLELARMSQNPKTTLGDMAEAKRQTEELRKTNLAKMEQPEKVRVSHILIATRQKDSEEELPPEQKKSKRELAQKLLARVKAGEDFAKLVKEFSEDRGLKETGGEYTFSRNDPFIPEFKAASFSLATNQISDLVTTVFGYHIIKLLEKIPARKVEFEKVKAEIKNLLLQQELQKQMPGYFQRLKKEAGVEVLDARYKLQPSKTANPLKPDN